MSRMHTLHIVPFVATFMAFVACGGGNANVTPPVMPSATASATSSAMKAALANLGPLPPKAEVPAPGVKGSSKVTLKHDASFEGCHRSLGGSGGADLSKDIERVARACDAATRMRPASDVLRAQVDDAGPAKTFSVNLQRGHCYRLYSASSPAIQSMALSLQASDGATIFDTHTDVAPVDGAICMTEGDRATLLVASGSGKGEIAVRVYGD